MADYTQADFEQAVQMYRDALSRNDLVSAGVLQNQIRAILQRLPPQVAQQPASPAPIQQGTDG